MLLYNCHLFFILDTNEKLPNIFAIQKLIISIGLFTKLCVKFCCFQKKSKIKNIVKKLPKTLT